MKKKDRRIVARLFGPVYKQAKRVVHEGAFYRALHGEYPLSLSRAVAVEEATGGKIKAEWLLSPKNEEALRRLLRMRGGEEAPPNPVREIKEGGMNDEDNATG